MDDGRIWTGLALLAATGAAAARGSLARGAGIVVVRVTPHRVGFAGAAVVRSMSRGRTHDPRAVDRVEVILGADDPAALRDPRAALDAAREAAQPHIHQGFARIVSQVYPGQAPHGPRHLLRIEVTS